jgi:hypothetical protein
MNKLNIPSRNNEGEAVQEHPSKFRISFKGDTGDWSVYDKSTKEKTTLASDKLVFMPLLRTSGASGYYEPANMGYWSNEILDSRKEILEVKGNDGSELAVGLWKDIKEVCNSKKVNFIANLYAAVKIDGNYEVAVIELKTTALVSFGEFAKAVSAAAGGKANAVYQVAVKVTGLTPKKKGAVNYVTPTFGTLAVSDAANQAASKLAETCENYLQGYFNDRAAHEPTAQAPKAESPRQGAHDMGQPPTPTEEDFEEAFGKEVPLFEDLGDLEDLHF